MENKVLDGYKTIQYILKFKEVNDMTMLKKRKTGFFYPYWF